MLKKILKMIFKKEIKEEIMPELDRKVINLLNKIDITQCFINRSIKKSKQIIQLKLTTEKVSKEVYIFTRQLVVLCDSFNWRYSYNIEECYNSYYIYRNLSTIIELNDDSYIELLISRFYINDHFMGLNIRIQLYSWDSTKHLYLYNKDVYTHGFGFAEGGNPMEDLLIEKLNNLFNNAPYVHVD